MTALRDAVETLATDVNLGVLGHLEGLAAVRDTAEALIRQEVGRERRDGVTWADIGAVLGLSAQGAQQRYRAYAPVARNRPRPSSRATAKM